MLQLGSLKGEGGQRILGLFPFLPPLGYLFLFLRQNLRFVFPGLLESGSGGFNFLCTAEGLALGSGGRLCLSPG